MVVAGAAAVVAGAGAAVVAGAGAGDVAEAGAADVAGAGATVLVAAAGADDAGVDERATLLLADVDPDGLPDGAPPDDVGAADVDELLVPGGVVAVSPLQADVNATAARATVTTAARATRPTGHRRRWTPLFSVGIRTPRFHFDTIGRASPDVRRPGTVQFDIPAFRRRLDRRSDTTGRPPTDTQCHRAMPTAGAVFPCHDALIR